MTTYSSDKAVPYVYICTHKETNQFYIGYREANVKLNAPSHLDLPKYKTSSKVVNPDWSNYTWTIVAEFFDPSDAYTFEQQLICDNWKNPLLLNGQYRLGELKKFRNNGPTGKPSPKKGIPTGKPAWNKGLPSPLKGIPNGRKGIPSERQKDIPAWNKGISTGPSPLKGRPTGKKGTPNGRKGIPHSAEHIKNCADAKRGKKLGPPSTEHKQKISDAKRGVPTGPNKSRGKLQPKVICPHCGEVGGNNNMKRYHFDNCKKKNYLDAFLDSAHTSDEVAETNRSTGNIKAVVQSSEFIFTNGDLTCGIR